MWHIERESGDAFLVFNDTGADVHDVEITARRILLDGRLRRFPHVPAGESVRIKLKAGFGTSDPDLLIAWTDASGNRVPFAIHLHDYF